VATLASSGKKTIFFHPKLIANVAVLDPRMTESLPAKFTAATGFDALTHSIEAFLAKGDHPMADAIALKSVSLVGKYLERAVKDPRDLDARGAMLKASMMGAVAFQKGLGLVHSCAHSLSAVADLHHGLANGVMIDHALAFNAPAVPERFAVMAETIGLADASPDGFLRWLADLKAELGLPAGLEALGVGGDAIGRLAHLAVLDACHLNNPRPVDEADFRAIFAAAG
jgi:4-hydroxybutyrate dehydrogenase